MPATTKDNNSQSIHTPSLRRVPMACTHCRERKVKCNPIMIDETTRRCQRCIDGHLSCRFVPIATQPSQPGSDGSAPSSSSPPPPEASGAVSPSYWSRSLSQHHSAQHRVSTPTLPSVSMPPHQWSTGAQYQQQRSRPQSYNNGFPVHPNGASTSGYAGNNNHMPYPQEIILTEGDWAGNGYPHPTTPAQIPYGSMPHPVQTTSNGGQIQQAYQLSGAAWHNDGYSQGVHSSTTDNYGDPYTSYSNEAHQEYYYHNQYDQQRNFS